MLCKSLPPLSRCARVAEEGVICATACAVQVISGGAENWLARGCPCSQIVCVKTVTYPIRIEASDYKRLVAEANRRRKSLADLFRDLITYGLPELPPSPETYEALQEVWDSLGPPPEILYDHQP